MSDGKIHIPARRKQPVGDQIKAIHGVDAWQ